MLYRNGLETTSHESYPSDTNFGNVAYCVRASRRLRSSISHAWRKYPGAFGLEMDIYSNFEKWSSLEMGG